MWLALSILGILIGGGFGWNAFVESSLRSIVSENASQPVDCAEIAAEALTRAQSVGEDDAFTLLSARNECRELRLGAARRTLYLDAIFVVVAAFGAFFFVVAVDWAFLGFWSKRMPRRRLHWDQTR